MPSSCKPAVEVGMFEELRERMQEHAHRIAIVSDGQEYTYLALAEAIAVKERSYRGANIGSGNIIALVNKSRQ